MSVPDVNMALTKLCTTCGYRLESTLERCPMDSTRLGRERPELMVLGSYRLVQRVGTGGMGVVYRGVHEKLGRTVAIKMMHRSLVSDRMTVVRFFQEARAVNTISHPNVVDVYDFVSTGDDIYLVMEFLVGQDLQQVLSEAGGRPLPVKRSVMILEQICGGLHAAHARNLVHRDLKPANVFLTQQNDAKDFVKLLDFGLSKLERVEGRMTRDGAILGTPEYMAPEQATGQPIDGRADLYAVGCIAYEMLTGHRLFTGGGHAEVMVRHVNEAPVPPRHWNPALPTALEDTILRCLAKQPAERPDTALSLAKDLCAATGERFDTTGAFMTTGPVHVVTEADHHRAAPAGGMPPPGPPASGLWARKELARWPAVGAAALIAILAAVVASSPLRPTRKVVVPGTKGQLNERPTRPTVDRLVDVLLQSTPAGADLVGADGAILGRAPHTLWAPLGSEQRIRFELPGYEPEERSFRVDTRTTIVVALQPSAPVYEAPATVQDGGDPPPRIRPARSGTKAAKSKKKGARGLLKSRDKTMNPFAR